jgi:methionine-rich copper-binding protein CopC
MVISRATACRVAVLLALAATDVAAHAVLTGSSLEGSRLAAGSATTVTLTFNSGIESGLAKVVLRFAVEP